MGPPIRASMASIDWPSGWPSRAAASASSLKLSRPPVRSTVPSNPKVVRAKDRSRVTWKSCRGPSVPAISTSTALASSGVANGLVARIHR